MSCTPDPWSENLPEFAALREAEDGPLRPRRSRAVAAAFGVFLPLVLRSDEAGLPSRPGELHPEPLTIRT